MTPETDTKTWLKTPEFRISSKIPPKESVHVMEGVTVYRLLISCHRQHLYPSLDRLRRCQVFQHYQLKSITAKMLIYPAKKSQIEIQNHVFCGWDILFSPAALKSTIFAKCR